MNKGNQLPLLMTHPNLSDNPTGHNTPTSSLGKILSNLFFHKDLSSILNLD